MGYQEKLAEQERFRITKKQCEQHEPRRHPGTSGAVRVYDFCKRMKKECTAESCPYMKENTNGKDDTGQ